MRLLTNKFNIVKPFKFFQKGTLDDPQMLEEMTRATASFNADTPDGHVYRRRLYHTDRDLYDRLRNPINNNEMERYFYDRNLPPDTLTSEVTRRINGGQPTGIIHNDNHGNTDYIPFFTGGPRVTRVNPNWKTKIKMFFQKLKTNGVIETHSEVIGILIFTTTVTVIFGLMIAKVLNIW